MEIQEIRIKCKILRVELGIDKKGYLLNIAEDLGVNYRSLNMALSGYRNGPSSFKLLEKLESYLLEKQNQEAA